MNKKTLGLSLIELLIASVIFTSALGVANQIIASGVHHTWILYPVEPWLNMMQQSVVQLQSLPDEHTLRVSGFHDGLFSNVTIPLNLQSWHIEWQEHAEYGVALFKAKTLDGKQIQWRYYQNKKF